ncbi:MAG: hypothetical protein R3280_04300 [Marinobacter sp.]|uniref:hypothetical protein n=1 Tax=Marinobacter sp. TaxID=50741 RepID=UPI00299DC693|nr:hypothetical protein [Marinobacter sp.]MDX1633832.1 hypothetical protein [Marinobacter sp.]
MLKELWRKTLGHPGLEGGSSASERLDGVSLSSHMTHTGEFHLERLTELLSARYGKTFGAGSAKADDRGIHQLIRFASRIQDQDIQRELLLFYLNCSPVVQDYLKSGGVFSEDHFISRNADQHPR